MNKPIDIKLIRAYSKLLKKDCKKISVCLLCETAEVSRASFYIYYKNMSEFEKYVSTYILNKFFDNSTYLLRCSEEELEAAINKENFFFDKYETDIIRYMISGSNYLDFACLADSYYLKEKEASLFTQEIWEKYKRELDFFSRGYLMILILGLTGYMGNTYKKDLLKCRELFSSLCSVIDKNTN